MAFTKTNWTETTAITPARLNNMESQLDDSKAYTDSHENKTSPHSGHVKGTMRITVSSVAPSNPIQGDIWIQI